MLNCFADYKRFIHISCHILDYVEQKKIKFTMEQPYMFPFLCWQYHAADALATLGASASAVMILIPKARIFCLQHQKS